ncbi:hypothetical protein AN232_15920 [Citrobacter sp. CRE-46]|nr:hypothetical protein AN232_15920 [Citrobacter sp. CRE-46]
MIMSIVRADLLEKAKNVVNGPQDESEIIKAALEYYIKMKAGRRWNQSDVDAFARKIEQLSTGEYFTIKELIDDWEDLNSSSQKTLGKKLSKYSKGSKTIKKTSKSDTNLQGYQKI